MARDPYASLLGWLYDDQPCLDSSIQHWARHMRFMRRFKTDRWAKSEVRYSCRVIEWKLAGEKGPAPEKEIPPLPRAPKLGGTLPSA